ncbi:MAG: hypothetical protein EHM23_29925 [Acidobacteria bacterium]|nr:MAG: hypothetical protein EHM23_29925 [Acidobacteriota bacterium]
MLKRLCCCIVLPVVILGGCYLLLLNFPQPLFRWSVQSDNLRLYSDRPFPPEAGRELLRSVQRKLASSPLYSAKGRHDVFICNSPWRRTVFFLPAPRGAGGANYHPWTSNVFLVAAAIEHNRLINRSGKPDVLGRSLDHFMTHEITHSLTSREVGLWHYQNLPDWIKEGYAEYVARGAELDYEQSVQAFLVSAPEMNPPKLVPYRRYETLVAFFLKHEGGIRRLLVQPRSQADAEGILRAAAGAPRP